MTWDNMENCWGHRISAILQSREDDIISWPQNGPWAGCHHLCFLPGSPEKVHCGPLLTSGHAFSLAPQSPSFAFQYWSGAWKRWGWMKPPWDPSWGLNYSFGCWHWAVPFTELNYTAPGIVLRWSSEPGQVCGHSSWGCSPGTAPPTGLGGSVSKVWKSTRGFLKHNWFQEILNNVDGWGYGMLISLYSSRTARSFIKRNE